VCDESTLDYHGFDTPFLKEEIECFTATGAQLLDLADLRSKRIDIGLLDNSSYSLARLNAAAWPVLKAAFETGDLDDLSKHVSAPHALQFIMISLANLAFHNKAEISNDILALQTRTTTTIPDSDLLRLKRDTRALTLLNRILDGDDIFLIKDITIPELAQLVRTHTNGDNGKTCSSRQDSSAAHVAIDMPSSYDDEIPSHTALGAIHIEPETWAPTLHRAAAHSSDDDY
jgi:hypothetical protein